ncbi:MAG: ubiquinone biosynthesis accessory factor UbiJ [Gammaproteobacteria bacterium]
MTVKPLLLSAMESALNGYLALDRNKDRFLSPLSGKVIAVRLQPFDETIYLCPTPESIQVLDQVLEAPDTVISGSPWALGWMGVRSKPMRSVFSGEVKIEGDIHTGRKFQELFEKLEINLEEKLSLFTGDWLAHQIGDFFRSGQDRTRQALETFRLNLTEFLQEETRDLPSVPEAEIHYRQVDELRTAYDRLASRLSRLEAMPAARNETRREQ